MSGIKTRLSEMARSRVGYWAKSGKTGKSGKTVSGRMSPMRTAKGRTAGRTVGRTAARRGFNIVELLLVVAIIGIIALIAVGEGSKTIRRAKLTGVAGDIETMVSRVPAYMQKRNQEMFILLGPKAADGSTPLQVWADSTADTILNTTNDTLVDSYSIPSWVALRQAPSTQITSTNWSANTDDTSVQRGLRLTFKQQTVSTLTGGTLANIQIKGLATLAITHADMLTNALSPLINYELRIDPIWHVKVWKGVWNGTSFVYSF